MVVSAPALVLAVMYQSMADPQTIVGVSIVKVRPEDWAMDAVVKPAPVSYTRATLRGRGRPR